MIDYYTIDKWMRRYSPIYIRIQNPYSWWWKVRKWFRRPKWIYDCSYHYSYKKLLCIDVRELDWKSKYGELRHVEDPMMYITLLGRTFVYRLVPDPKYMSKDMSLCWYETIMAFGEWLREHKNCAASEQFTVLHKIIDDNTWSAAQSRERICAWSTLTDYGLRAYNIASVWEQPFVCRGDLKDLRD